MLGLEPLHVISHRDRWHKYLLAQVGPQARIIVGARKRLLSRLRGDG